MKFWILLILALLLLVWSVREGFNPATQRPEKSDGSLRGIVEAMGGTRDNTVIDGYIESLQKYYDTKYLPEKKTPVASVVDDFVKAEQLKPQMTKDGLKRMIEYVFLSTSAPPSNQKTTEDTSKTTTGGSSNPTGSMSGNTTGGSSNPTGSMSGNTTGGSSNPTGSMSGNTTGGSSNPTGSMSTTTQTSSGPHKQKVFGPLFTGMDGDGSSSIDSSKTNKYPELLGGQGAVASKQQQNVMPTAGGLGVMPTAGGLGATEMSVYFPFSRQPGDMELIPDPYRVSQQFSAANYSFKTEPTPFLTDFSAFLK